MGSLGKANRGTNTGEQLTYVLYTPQYPQREAWEQSQLLMSHLQRIERLSALGLWFANLHDCIPCRFDLLHVMVDEPCEDSDGHIAWHIMRMHQRRERAVHVPFTKEQIQLYIRYCRGIRPRITQQVDRHWNPLGWLCTEILVWQARLCWVWIVSRQEGMSSSEFCMLFVNSVD